MPKVLGKPQDPEVLPMANGSLNDLVMRQSFKGLVDTDSFPHCGYRLFPHCRFRFFTSLSTWSLCHIVDYLSTLLIWAHFHIVDVGSFHIFDIGFCTLSIFVFTTLLIQALSA